MHEGYSFRWDAGKNPVLVSPTGRSIPIEVDGDIPYVSHRAPASAMPAEAASSDDPPAIGGDPPADPPAEDLAIQVEDDTSKEVRLRAEANSLAHLLTHRYKNPYCSTCQQAKLEGGYPSRGATVWQGYHCRPCGH